MKAERRVPTLADIDALPPGIKGEIVERVLYTTTRPRGPHQQVATRIAGGLLVPFDFEGPGGWRILIGPGIELPRSPEFAPDIAGWRRERLPGLTHDAPIRVVPEWICE